MRSEVFEARPRAAVRWDARILALSDGSRQVLDWLGVWSSLDPTPIATIHISHRGAFGRTCLSATEQGVPALGWCCRQPADCGLDAASSTPGHRLSGHDPSLRRRHGTLRPDCLCRRRRGFRLGREARLRASTPCFAKSTWRARTATLPTSGSPTRAAGVAAAGQPVCRRADLRRRARRGRISAWRRRILGVLQRRFGNRHRFRRHAARCLPARSALSARTCRRAPRGWAMPRRPCIRSQDRASTWRCATSGNSPVAPPRPATPAPGALAAYAAGRRADRRGAIAFTDLLIDGFGTEFAPIRHARGVGSLARSTCCRRCVPSSPSG